MTLSGARVGAAYFWAAVGGQGCEHRSGAGPGLGVGGVIDISDPRKLRVRGPEPWGPVRGACSAERWTGAPVLRADGPRLPPASRALNAPTGGAPCAARAPCEKEAILDAFPPMAKTTASNCRVPIRRTAQILTQSKKLR